MQTDDLKKAIKRIAKEIGYIDCGITTADPFERFETALRERMASFPEATHLYKDMLNRVDPRRTTPWAHSIVACVRRYGKYRLPSEPVGHIGRNYLADQRLEVCPDYEMPRKMTDALRQLGLKVKRGGTPDRLAAARAGAAKILRNGFAYHERAGSWINIATWRIDAEIAPDEPTFECPCPAGCRACMDQCPTSAIAAPYTMRMDRCVAYLTYHAPSPVPDELWQKMGPWVYGCDACQTACPLNAGKWEDLEPAPWLEEVKEHLAPEALAEMDEETYRNRVHPLFWYISKDNVERWRQNARRANQANTD